MKNLKAKLNKQSGFTLIEMLIVVAIIAILVAVSIPLVGSALEKARDATDQANERAAKAEAAIKYLGIEDGDFTEHTGTFWYDAVNGTLIDSAGTGAAKPAAYGKCTGASGCYTPAGATAAADHTSSIIQVVISAGGGIAISWVGA